MLPALGVRFRHGLAVEVDAASSAEKGFVLPDDAFPSHFVRLSNVFDHIVQIVQTRLLRQRVEIFGDVVTSSARVCSRLKFHKLVSLKFFNGQNGYLVFLTLDMSVVTALVGARELTRQTEVAFAENDQI